MSEERTSRFRVLHGVVKGAIRNIIDLAHSRIHKDDLLTDGKNRPNMPELANIALAFDGAIDKFVLCNSDGSWKNTQAYRTGVKAKEVGLSFIASDSAYYLMLEYGLKEYVHMKMDDAFGKEAVEKAFVEQWKKRREELITK